MERHLADQMRDWCNERGITLMASHEAYYRAGGIRFNQYAQIIAVDPAGDVTGASVQATLANLKLRLAQGRCDRLYLALKWGWDHVPQRYPVCVAYCAADAWA
jgi:hypothetical protein